MTEQERLEREAAFATALFGLFVSMLFSLPLLADPIARALGFYVFFLMDPFIQLFWAAILLIWPGWAIYRSAGVALWSRRLSPALVVAPLSLWLFAQSLAVTLGAAEGPVRYQAQAGVITLYHLGWVLALILGFPRRYSPTK